MSQSEFLEQLASAPARLNPSQRTSANLRCTLVCIIVFYSQQSREAGQQKKSQQAKKAKKASVYK
eukprot:7352425-Pyramimonas_sp.AAC.1